MTKDIHLVVDLERFNVRPQGPAIAGIWFVSADIQFPMVGWLDFVVVVLRWIAEAMLGLLRNNVEMQRVHFMDGPYAVAVARTQSGRVQFWMFAGPSGGRVVAEGEADVRSFVDELVGQSRRLLEACRLRDWWSVDAEALASDLQALDGLLASL